MISVHVCVQSDMVDLFIKHKHKRVCGFDCKQFSEITNVRKHKHVLIV